MSYDQPGAPPPPPQGWQQPQAGAPYPASSYGYPPGGGGGYGAAGATPLKPLKGLSTALMILLGITALAAIFAAVAFFNRASAIDDFFNSSGSFGDLQKLKDADDQVGAGSGLFSFAALATAVLWIIWQFRHAKNAVALRGRTGLAPGWAIGGWFIPVGNFVVPELQLMQAAKASDPALPAGQPAASGKAPGVLYGWWALFVASAVLNVSGSGIRPGRDDPGFDIDKYTQADRVQGFAMLVFIAAAIAGIFLVKTL